MILIDLLTEEGIVGRSYLEPYTAKAMRYLIPALHDFGDLLKGRGVAPIELHELARKSLHFVGYQGLAVIAVSGLDMAAWDALAKAAGLPLCVLLGGTVGPVKAYNSRGLWLKNPELVAAEATELRDEDGFTGLKLRLGRENARDDLKAIHAVRASVGDACHLMVDFNQGLDFAEALHRGHLIDDLGLDWIEEPIIYDNFDGFNPVRILSQLIKKEQRCRNIFFYGSVGSETTGVALIQMRAREHRGFRSRLLAGGRTVREAWPMLAR